MNMDVIDVGDIPVASVEALIRHSDGWYAARKLGIGGSDAAKIMSGDWLPLWEEKTGRAESEDLSGVLPVVMGTWTEPLNRYWFEPAIFLAALLGGPAALAAEAPAAADPVKGQAAAATCLACHTADGSRGAPANPILQGQFPEYLAKQLHDFRAGKRKNAVMQGMAAAMAEGDILHVAAFYATKQPKPGFAKHKDSVLLGEKIWRGGITDRKVPACAGCHGPNGAGVPSQYPRLSGQHADYTEAQMVAFRSGARANSVQMTGVAAKMNDAEIKAVSDYIAGLR